ncbi:tRNA guanosine(34) transglycosylase Tgt [Patescibacteria group bacterium]|nr:MAG: tRNA guanosine(34) transglycosylase Tgt [Patescibacteria group bacterium]
MLTRNKSKKVNNGRVLKTRRGQVNLPVFMPIATKGAVRNLNPEELEKLGAEIALGNTYHLWLRPGDTLIKKAGGLHEFMRWSKPILTDSGGFQVFSLGARAAEKYGKSGVTLTERGVRFVDPIDGKAHFMSPEKSIDIQLNLGSDIIMVLDECPPYPCELDYARASMELTLRWAVRCQKYFQKKTKHLKKNKRPLLFAIVQGSVYQDLRQECAERLVAMDFDGYAIGGVAVGEPREKLAEILDWVVPILPENRPRYLMGLGRPEEVVAAVQKGIDMFDCVIPTREGRHGRLFLRKRKQKLNVRKSKVDFYETININNGKFRNALQSIDMQCQCYTCQRFSRAYLRHLFAVGEPLALRLASIHNLFFYLELMRDLRQQRLKEK